jgi:WD40 repeat protein
MDWTIPLHVQQQDFITRLQELRRCPNSSPILNHDCPGVWSEQVKIYGDRLSTIRADCRQRIVKSDPIIPVNELWKQYLLEELAVTTVSLIWPHSLRTSAADHDPNHDHNHGHNHGQDPNRAQCYWLEDASGEPESWLRVQVMAVTGETITEVAGPVNPNESDLVIWVWIQESLDDAYQDYHPIILGFLPSDRLPSQNTLHLDQLWYGGGLRGYVEANKSRQLRQSQAWLRPLMGSANCPYPLAIAADGKTIASTSYDGSLKLWRLSDTQLQDALGGRTWSTAPSTTGSAGQTLSTRDADQIYHCCHSGQGQLLRSLPGLRSGVTAVLLDFPGEQLICGSQGGKIEIWQVESGQKQHSFTAHEGGIRFLAISASGSLFASTGSDRQIRVWQWRDQTLTLLFSQIRDGISSITLSPDGSQVGCGFQNGQIEVWSVASGESFYRLKAHSGPVRSLSLSDDGTSLASSSVERTLKLWKTDSGNLDGLRTGHADPLISVSPNADGCWVDVSLFQADPPSWAAR